MKKIFSSLALVLALLSCGKQNSILAPISSPNQNPSTSSWVEGKESWEPVNTELPLKVITSESLSIKKKSPKKIEIVWPTKLVAKMKLCSLGRGGTGFTIDWGDAPDPKLDRCALTHTYSWAWSYAIKATLWHAWPVDEPEIEWKGEEKVVIQ